MEKDKKIGHSEKPKRTCDSGSRIVWENDKVISDLKHGLCDDEQQLLEDEDEEEGAALEMGFEKMYPPGKKKRPYCIITSQHADHHSEQQQEAKTHTAAAEAGELKIPVPRFYSLQVGAVGSSWEELACGSVPFTLASVNLSKLFFVLIM